VGALIVVSPAGLALGAKAFGFEIDAAFVGLSLSYALSITNTMGWMVITGTSAEAEMSRVERILHYGGISPEASLTTEPQSKYSEVVADASDWPRTGRIEFQRAVMAYKPSLPPVGCFIFYMRPRFRTHSQKKNDTGIEGRFVCDSG